MKIKRFSIIVICTLTLVTFVHSFSSAIEVFVDGEQVIFTDNYGYPFVDTNNRSLIPLKVITDTIGVESLWDNKERAVELVVSNTKISIPIDKNYMYRNGERIDLDSKAIVKNGRTYLPMKAVFEILGYAVEWDASTKSVFAYSDRYENSWVAYSSGNLITLIDNILAGNVIYKNGSYWASPEYYASIENEEIVYSNDISSEELTDRYALSEISFDSEWISDAELQQQNIYFSKGTAISSGFDINLWGFKTGTTITKTLLAIPSFNISLLNENEHNFNGIRMKSIDGMIQFNKSDLMALSVIKN